MLTPSPINFKKNIASQLHCVKCFFALYINIFQRGSAGWDLWPEKLVVSQQPVGGEPV
jgi:hypothetical protein